MTTVRMRAREVAAFMACSLLESYVSRLEAPGAGVVEACVHRRHLRFATGPTRLERPITVQHDRLTHLPPQRVSLALLQPQPPLLHVDPVPEHTVPHWPQLLESVDRLTHLPLQTTSSHGQRVLVRDEKSLCIAA